MIILKISLLLTLYNLKSFYQGFWFFSFSYSFIYTSAIIILNIWNIFNIFLIYLSGDKDMNKKFNCGLAIILPNKRINLFVLFIIVLGVISGTIFLLALNEVDKELVSSQLGNFMVNINENNLNNFNAFKNSLIENLIFVFLIWILGMSVIGIVFNIFLVYLKGFVIGFTLSSFFMLYSYKGLLGGAIYLIPSGIINLFVTLVIGVYSVILTINLWKLIFMRNRTNNIRKCLKNYLIILVICIILIIIVSLCEGYLVPALFKLVIKLFI